MAECDVCKPTGGKRGSADREPITGGEILRFAVGRVGGGEGWPVGVVSGAVPGGSGSGEGCRSDGVGSGAKAGGWGSGSITSGCRLSLTRLARPSGGGGEQHGQLEVVAAAAFRLDRI